MTNNKSRMLAGYCWDWVSKNNPKLDDITFPEFKFSAKWNLESRGAPGLSIQNRLKILAVFTHHRALNWIMLELSWART